MTNDFDRYDDGTICPVRVLRPAGGDWAEVYMSNADKRQMGGYPIRAFMHTSRIFVMSAVEAIDEGDGKQLQYHLSISLALCPGVASRIDSNAAAWVLKEFKAEGFEEDNHVESGKVRNFWRPVADSMVGRECECKENEPAVIEDKGDYVWRHVEGGKDV